MILLPTKQRKTTTRTVEFDQKRERLFIDLPDRRRWYINPRCPIHAPLMAMAQVQFYDDGLGGGPKVLFRFGDIAFDPTCCCDAIVPSDTPCPVCGEHATVTHGDMEIRFDNLDPFAGCCQDSPVGPIPFSTFFYQVNPNYCEWWWELDIGEFGFANVFLLYDSYLEQWTWNISTERTETGTCTGWLSTVSGGITVPQGDVICDEVTTALSIPGGEIGPIDVLCGGVYTGEAYVSFV